MNKIILLADINECTIVGWQKNTGEVNARVLKVEMCDELSGCAEQLVTFKLENGTVYESKVINGVAEIPIIDEPQHVKIGLYTLDFEGDKPFRRYSSKPAHVYVNTGSYNDEANNPPIPTPGTYADLKKYVDKKIGDFKISLVTEITEESTDEEIPSALSVFGHTKGKLEEFKEKEIDYTTIYSYDALDLKNRKSHISGKPIYKIVIEKKNETDCIVAIVKYNLFISYKAESGDMAYYVETPLKVVPSESVGFAVENLSNLCDIGLMVDGKAYPLTRFLEELTDDVNFYDGDVSFSYTVFNNTEILLNGVLKVASKNEQAVDQLLTEVEGMLTLYGDKYLLYYKNPPEIETIQAQYIGGN